MTAQSFMAAFVICTLPSLYQSADAREDRPLTSKMKRWEYVVVVQAGDMKGDQYTRNSETKIIKVLRGQEKDFPKLETRSPKDMVKGRFYLMHYHKSPPGTSAWRHDDLEDKDGTFVVKSILTDRTEIFDSDTVRYRDLPMTDFEKLLVENPFQ